MVEFNAKLGRLKVSLEWRLTLFAILLVPAMTWLGLWQLERAEEKRQLLTRHEQQMALPPLSAAELLSEVSGQALSDFADRRIDAKVRVNPSRYLLIDNKQRAGKVGFELVVLASLATDPAVWIPLNTGWVQGDPARRALPPIELANGEAEVRGRLFVPESEAYVLGEQSTIRELPAVIQSFDAGLLQDIADAEAVTLIPHQLRLDADSDLARVTDWPVVNQSPEKHTGYAVQWFTMASVLALAFVARSTNIVKLLRGAA